MLEARELSAEWLEADGFGGFASGTVGGVRTRRYHALLLAALEPPGRRVVLVSGLEVWLTTRSGRFALSTQRYAEDVVSPDGRRHIVRFTTDPWPTWTLRPDEGLELTAELMVDPESGETLLRWRALKGDGLLEVRPLLSGRDYHALHAENVDFDFSPLVNGGNVSLRPYAGLPPVSFLSNGVYSHGPEWYRQFFYEHEHARGLDCMEDLASPGTISYDLQAEPALLLLHVGIGIGRNVRERAQQLLEQEGRRRRALGSVLSRSARAYVVQRGEGKTILAGFPWFMDYGRDAFVALRGLCIASGRFQEAAEILVSWARPLKRGMLPNRFAERGEDAEYNSVDASLWFVIAAHELMRESKRHGVTLPAGAARTLERSIDDILDAYSSGARYGICATDDGLLAAGEPGTQLTWMDAKIDGWVITPRVGKPVEVQALWINALAVGAERSQRWRDRLEVALRSFRERFWNPALGALYDVVDVNHERGQNDASFRPNQIFAVGGLPLMLLDLERSRRVVDEVQRRLLTPIGLRSLAPDEPGYCPNYAGGLRERDAAYHQGTVWPWLIGPFVEAWLRVYGCSATCQAMAFNRFMQPFIDHLRTSGLGHVSELADAASPHTPRGAPFQAWSLGELLRVLRLLGRDPPHFEIDFQDLVCGWADPSGADT